MLFGVLSARQPNGQLAGYRNLELQGMPRLAQVSSPVPALPAESAAPTRTGPLAGIRTKPGLPGSAQPSASSEQVLCSELVPSQSASNPTFKLRKVSASWDLPSPFPTRLPAGLRS